MTSPHQTANERAWYLDYLRIAGMFFIVLLHVVPLGQTAYGAPGWAALSVVSSLCRWCVPVYFMISGALFLSPRRPCDTRRLFRVSIARLLCSFFFWAAVYALVYCVAAGKGKWTFLNQFLRGHYHMWFIPAIIGLYWATPLLRCITQDRRATEYLLAAGLLIAFLPGRLIGFILLFDPPHSDVLQSLQSLCNQLNPYRGLSGLYYFVLGHYLHEYPTDRRKTRLLIAGGAAGLAGTAFLTLWHSSVLNAASAHFTDAASLTVLAASAGVFVLFRRLCGGCPQSSRTQSAVRLLSGCMFGVCLLHPLFIEHLLPAFPQAPALLLISVLLRSLGVFALSLGISALIRRIPVLGRHII